tara:strand:+ start:87 stop:329 length:243 start_codon:yes stop_codon:yes gene_type:complete
MSLKLVKNAHLENNDGIIQIRHYETIIFSFDPLSNKAIVKKDLSVTSNKQIKFAMMEFNPLKTIEMLPDQKWSYSGEYTQ